MKKVILVLIMLAITEMASAQYSRFYMPPDMQATPGRGSSEPTQTGASASAAARNMNDVTGYNPSAYPTSAGCCTLQQARDIAAANGGTVVGDETQARTFPDVTQLPDYTVRANAGTGTAGSSSAGSGSQGGSTSTAAGTGIGSTGTVSSSAGSGSFVGSSAGTGSRPGVGVGSSGSAGNSGSQGDGINRDVDLTGSRTPLEPDGGMEVDPYRPTTLDETPTAQTTERPGVRPRGGGHIVVGIVNSLGDICTPVMAAIGNHINECISQNRQAYNNLETQEEVAEMCFAYAIERVPPPASGCNFLENRYSFSFPPRWQEP